MTAESLSPLKTADRRVLLLRAVRRQGGVWTPKRVQRLYLAAGLLGLHPSTVRGDLKALHTDGHLTLNDTPGRRFYTPKDGAQ